MRAARWLATVGAVAVAVTIGFSPAAGARPLTISVPCPSNGSTLEVRSWTSTLRDGSGASQLRRVRIGNGCAEAVLLAFYGSDAFVPTSTLVVEAGASSTFVSTDLGVLGWDVPTQNGFAVGLTPGATASTYCTQTVTLPTWILRSDGSLVPFACP